MFNDGTFVTPLVVIGGLIHSVINFQQKSGFFSMSYLLFIVQHFYMFLEKMKIEK
jgi:hypothetical protein